MNRRVARLVVVLSAIVVWMAPSSHAQSGFHAYSIAQDTGAGLYTGIETARTDGVYTVTANIVYAPLWIIFNATRTA